jgi:predicted RecA/RadA family phage recombinase
VGLNVTGVGSPVQEGKYINYTPTFDVAAGRVVVIGNFVGIAPRPIAANAEGVVQVEGVVALPKPSAGAGAETIAAGALVYFATGASGVATTAVTGVKAGYAVAQAVTGSATVDVKLDQ